MSNENDSSDDEQFDQELDSDDEIAIILNVHVPQPSQNEAGSAYPDNFQFRPISHDQFAPTNPISYPGLQYNPVDTEPKNDA